MVVSEAESVLEGEVAGVQLKQARSRLSTSRLLRASAELIAEVGYERTTLAAIGKRAGYSHGLVTRRFGSKEGMIQALLDRTVKEWSKQEISPILNSKAGFEGVRDMIDAIRTSLRRDPMAMRALYTLMFEALKPTPAALADRMRHLHSSQRRNFEELLVRGIDDGSVRPDIDPAATAGMVVGVLRGAAYQWLLDRDFDFDATLVAMEAHLESSLHACVNE